MLKLRSALAIAWLLASVANAEPQQTSTSLFFDSVDINIINVDVMVTDAQGQPVTGLTPADFTLFENGEPVEISNFFAVENQQATRDLKILGPELDDIELANDSQPAAQGPETHQLNLVIFIDDSNIKPKTRNVIFANLRRYLAADLADDDRVMLVKLDDRLEIIHEFTSDADRLAASLDQLELRVGGNVRVEMPLRILLREMETTPLLTNTDLDVTKEDYTEARALKTARDMRFLAEQLYARGKATTEVLGQFAASLAGLRGRKAILYVSDGISLRPSDALVQSWLNKFESWALNHDRRTLTSEVGSLVRMDLDLSSAFDKLAREANSHQVSFYPISAKESGFVGGHVSAEFSGDGLLATSVVGVRSADVSSLDENLRQSSLLQLAHDTGGVALTSSTNIGKLIDTVKHDFSNFYSLGYTAEAIVEGQKDRFRRLEVKVSGKGWKVRHAKGLRQKDSLDHLRQLTLAASQYGVVDNPLAAQLDPGKHRPGEKSGQFRISVMVKIPFSHLLLLPDDRYYQGRISMFVIARDPAGGSSPMRHIELPIQVPNKSLQDTSDRLAAYPFELELGAGPKRISIGLRDQLAQVDSTINLEIDVGASAAPNADPLGGG